MAGRTAVPSFRRAVVDDLLWVSGNVLQAPGGVSRAPAAAPGGAWSTFPEILDREISFQGIQREFAAHGIRVSRKAIWNFFRSL